MTRKQLRNRFNFLKKGLSQNLAVTLEKALKSGALDLSKYDDDFELPKIIVTAALRREAYQWAPLTEDGKAEVRNLELFI